jgi:hypothetical protein
MTDQELMVAARGYKDWLHSSPASEVLYSIRGMADDTCGHPVDADCLETIRKIAAYAQQFLDTGKVPPDDEGGVT